MKRQLRRLTMALATTAVAINAPTVASAQAPEPSTTGTIDKTAVDALNKMGTYLRSLKTFEVKGEVTNDEVLLDGQKIQIASNANLVAEKPGRLRVELKSDRKDRIFLYDGKQFTMVAPRLNYYATVPAPGTIGELADSLESKYGIDLPFVDLFRWGTNESNVALLTSADDVGPATIDGVTCEQYAFRQAGLDWQIWIQEGEFPLPRKLVITTTTDAARPTHSATYAWNLAPSVSPEAFAFVPNKDATKIPLADLPALRAAAAKKRNGGGQ